MTLSILRGVFILLAASVTALYVLSFQRAEGATFGAVTLMILLTIAVAASIIGVDAANPKKRLSSLSGVFLGLIAGLVAAFALSFVVDLIGVLTQPDLAEPLPDIRPGSVEFYTLNPEDRQIVQKAWNTYEAQNDQHANYLNLLQGVKVVIGLITCYLGISLVIQTKDDFRFVIPYVEFTKQIRGSKPTLLDTSVLVDGRIVDIIETHVLQGVYLVPNYVLEELQTIADSADKLKRARGRRGLDILQKLEQSSLIELHIDDNDAEGHNVDQKLIARAQQIEARVMTNDFNLNKVATLRGIDVVNINDLARALRPVVLPGEQMNVKMVKPGEGPTQGVGYLDDGTMVVVEGGRACVGDRIDLVVTSTLQTSAGRMIFGTLEGVPDPSGTEAPEAPAPPDEAVASSTPRAPRTTAGRNPRRSR